MKTVKMTHQRFDHDKSKGEKRYVAYRLHVPSEIGRMLIAKGIEHFTVEMTDEGLLYRPVKGEKVPEWLKED